jgi:hypothetical protein
MSTIIDNKIVEMSFNNSDFEKNAQQTIETTEKLKSSLNFESAGKGLEQLGSAAKSCDIGVLATAAEAVSDKFDTMKYLGIMALQDIYNAATRTAAQLVNTFAIQPVSSGFAEYELKMGSIQTIMASTSASLEEVNSYLDELNTYADKTIYSFADMTNNIGKFTNAGVSLDQAVAAIQGISNEAAVSGANTNEASRAMYNFAQALSAGYVKLIDWKSIENANMATVEFKNELISTAVELGNLEAQADGTYKVLTSSSTGSTMSDAISATQNFNDSLQYQWMTTDVLTQTLAKYSDETTEIGKKAFAAATEVKTFSMMMDTLEEAAGSGWTETWEILVGDFEQAKKFWTKLTDYFDDIIGDMSDARNTLLEDTLGSGFDLIENSFESTFEDAGKTAEDFENKIKELGTSSGLAMDTIIEEAGSMGAAFESGALSTDLITQAISEMATTEGISESKTKSLTDAASDMFDNFHEKSGRTLLQGSLYNTLDSIKMVIETIANTWDKLDDTFTSSKIYSVIQNINQATTDFKSYISDNLADPWNDVETAISDAGMDMDTFQSKLADTGRKSNIDVDALVKEYGSLQACFEAGVLTGDLVLEMLEDMNSSSESTANAVSEGTSTVSNAVEDATETLQYYQKVVDEVWNGDWSKQQDRYDKLAAAGYDYVKVQDLVNRTVDGHRITLEDLNAVGVITTETTQEEAEALVELANTAKESGSSINEALNKLGKKTGLQLAVEAIHDLFEATKTIAIAFRDAVVESFDSSIISSYANKAYSAITWIQKKTQSFSNYITSRSNELKRTFTGVYKVVQSIAKDVGSIITGLIKVTAKLFSQVGDAAPDVLDMTANVGDLLSKIADGLDVSEDIDAFFDNLVNNLPNVIQVISDVIGEIKQLPVIGDIITSGENIWDGISGDVSTEIDKIKSGETNVHDAIIGVGNTIVSAMAGAAQTVKTQGIQGVIDVFKGGEASVSEVVSSFASTTDDADNTMVANVQGFLGNLGNAALAIAPIVGSFAVLNGVSDVIKSFSKAIETLAGPLASAEKVLNSTSSFINEAKTQLTNLGNAVGFAIKTEAFINLAIAVGIIAGVMVVLAQIAASNPEGVQTAVYAVVGILVAMLGVMYLAAQFNTKQTLALKLVSNAAMRIAVVAGVLTLCVVALGSMQFDALKQGLIALGIILVMLAAFMAVVSVTAKNIKIDAKIEMTFTNMAKLILSIGASFLLIAAGIAIINKCDAGAMQTGLTIFIILAAVIAGIVIAALVMRDNAVALASMETLFTQLAAVIASIGTAFVLIAAGIFIIGQLSEEQLNRAKSTLVQLGVFIAALIMLSGIAAKIGQGQAITISANVLAMVVAVGLMAALAIALSYVDFFQFTKGVVMLAEISALCVAMYGVMAFITQRFGVEKLTSMGLTLVAMSVTIGIMAAIAVLLGYCDVQKLTTGIAFVGVLVVFASVLALAASQLKKDDVGAIASLAAAVAILAVIAVTFTLLDPAKLGIAVTALSTLMICFGILAVCMTKLNRVKIPMGTVIQLLAVMVVIAAVIALLCAFIPNIDQAANVGAGISLIMVSLAAMLQVLAKMSTRLVLANKTIKQMIPTLVIAIAIMVICGTLIAACCAIGGDKVNNALIVAAAIGVLMLTLAASLEAFSHIKGTINGTVVASLALLIVAIGMIAIVIGVMTASIGDRATQAIAIAGILATMLAVLTTCTIALSKLAGKNVISYNTIHALGMLSLCLIPIGLVITVMTNVIDPNKAGTAYTCAIALSMILVALSACVVLMTRFGGTATIPDSVIATLVVMSLVVAVVGTVLSTLISQIGDKADAALPIAAALSIVLAAITAAVIVLSRFSGFELDFGVVGTFIVVTAAVWAIGSALSALINAVGNNADAAIPAATALSLVLVALGSVATILTRFSGTFLQGLAGVGTLSALILAIVAVLGIIGGIDGLLGGGLKSSIEAAMDIFVLLAGKMGEAIGSFVGGIGVGLADQLIQIVTKVMTAMMMLSVGCSGIDESAFSKIHAFADAITALAGAEIAKLISNFLGGDQLDFAATLTKLGEGVKAFATATAGVDLSGVETGANAAKALSEALSNMPTEGGILGAIFGNADYSKFATGVTQIGEALPAFVKSVGDITTDNVQPSCEALTTLIECFNNIPQSGGLLQQILGGTDYSRFAQGVKDIGKALPKYVEAVGDTNTETVQPSADALSYLLEKLKDMPTEGGFLNFFTGGTMDVSDFATLLPTIGTALKSYCDNVDGANLDAGHTAATNLSIIVNDLKNMQTSGITRDSVNGFTGAIEALNNVDMSKLSSVYGDDNTSIFNKIVDSIKSGIDEAIQSVDFSSVGTTLHDKMLEGLSSAFSTDSSGNLNSIVSTMASALYNGQSTQSFHTIGINLANMLKNGMNEGLNATDASNISIGTIITDITNTVNSYNQSLLTAGINLGNWFKNGFNQAFATFDSLTGTMSSLCITLSTYYSNFYTSGINLGNAFKDGLSNAFGDISAQINVLISTLNGQAASFNAPGYNAMINYAFGIASGGSAVLVAMRLVCANVLSTISSYTNQYETVGLQLAKAFASGIGAGNSYVVMAAIAMCAAAKTSLNDLSSSFQTAGYYAAVGFANGIQNGAYKAKIAATAMANAAKTAAEKTLDINSPSKVFEQIGDYTGQGLANGIKGTVGLVENAASRLGDAVISGYNATSIDMTALGNATLIPSLDTASIANGINNLDLTSATMAFTPKIDDTPYERMILAQHNQTDVDDRLLAALGEIQGILETTDGLAYKPTVNVANNVVNDYPEMINATRDYLKVLKLYGQV